MRGLTYVALLLAVYYVFARLQAWIQYLLILRVVRMVREIIP
ncbi:MAG: hypothetical protein QN206_12415 [Armatimonadota bacterium]|nr:hypothetical protein [Armatimonadota bacterium]